MSALRLPVDPSGLALGGDGDGDDMNNNNILSTHSSSTNLGGIDEDDNSQIEMQQPQPRVQPHGVFHMPRHHRSHQATMDIQDNRL